MGPALTLEAHVSFQARYGGGSGMGKSPWGHGECSHSHRKSCIFSNSYGLLATAQALLCLPSRSYVPARALGACGGCLAQNVRLMLRAHPSLLLREATIHEMLANVSLILARFTCKNVGCPVKFAFQINDKCCFRISISLAVILCIISMFCVSLLRQGI